MKLTIEKKWLLKKMTKIYMLNDFITKLLANILKLNKKIKNS